MNNLHKIQSSSVSEDFQLIARQWYYAGNRDLKLRLIKSVLWYYNVFTQRYTIFPKQDQGWWIEDAKRHSNLPPYTPDMIEVIS